MCTQALMYQYQKRHIFWRLYALQCDIFGSFGYRIFWSEFHLTWHTRYVRILSFGYRWIFRYVSFGFCIFCIRTSCTKHTVRISVDLLDSVIYYVWVYLWIRARCTVLYIACKATVRSGAPLLELSWYLFSKYKNIVADVNLAISLLHKSRRKIWKNEALRRYIKTNKTRKWQN